MSRVKRWTAVVLAIACVSAAAQDFTIVLDNAQGKRGQEIEVGLSVDNPGAFAGLNAKIDLPPGVTFVRAETSGVLSPAGADALVDGNASAEGNGQRLALVIASRNGDKSYAGPGEIVKLVLKLAANAPLGKASMKFVEGSGAVSNTTGDETLASVFVGGDVTIQAGSASADINADGSVNAVDVQLVVNAVLGLPIGSFNSDVNADGITNAVDLQATVNAVLGIS